MEQRTSLLTGCGALAFLERISGIQGRGLLTEWIACTVSTVLDRTNSPTHEAHRVPEPACVPGQLRKSLSIRWLCRRSQASYRQRPDRRNHASPARNGSINPSPVVSTSWQGSACRCAPETRRIPGGTSPASALPPKTRRRTVATVAALSRRAGFEPLFPGADTDRPNAGNPVCVSSRPPGKFKPTSSLHLSINFGNRALGRLSRLVRSARLIDLPVWRGLTEATAQSASRVVGTTFEEEASRVAGQATNVMQRHKLLERPVGSEGAAPTRESGQPMLLGFPRVKPDDAVGDVVVAALRGAVSRISSSDPDARRGDAEGIHRLRTSTRRLRSELSALAGLVDQHWREPIENELKWLAGLLGSVRDLDILLARLRAASPPERLESGGSARRPS